MNRIHPGRGYSLISVAVSLTVLGLLAIGFVSYWQSTELARQARLDRDLMARSERALLGFVYSNHRLPCPDVSGDGREDIDPSTDRCLDDAQKGSLPWRTLGLPEQRAAKVMYGVFRAPGATAADLDLAAERDRFRPLKSQLTAGGASATETLLGNDNLLDFCFALFRAGRRAATSATDTGKLHLAGPQGQVRRQVAYALATPGSYDASGDGNVFDGRQAAAAPAFDPPSRGRSASNDDLVAAAGFKALSGYFGCEQALAAVGHTHFNAASMAVMLHRAFLDYKSVLEIEKLLSAAGVTAAVSGLASSGAGIASASADVALEIAQTIGTYGALSPTIALGVAAVGLETQGLVLAAAGLGSAVAADILVKARLDEVDGFIDRADSLATEIGGNAEQADSGGI